MALTPYLGLSYFGGDIPGSLADDGAKFTGADPLLLDRLLYLLAQASHHKADSAGDHELDAPSAVVGTDGTLPGGTDFTYVVTLLDASGVESLPSEEVTVSTPALLEPPVQPEVDVVAGGTLPTGLYYYALTTVNGSEQSTLGDVVTVTLLPGEGSVRITFPQPAPERAVQYRVWRMEASDVGWTAVALAGVADAPFLDTGSTPANPDADRFGQGPPQETAGEDNYSVTVSLADPDAALVRTGAFMGWRLYRTETASSWPAVSLVHQVVEPVDASDNAPLRTTWTDDGDVLTTGTPPRQASAFAIRPYVLDSADTLPAPTGYPEFYPLLVQGVLYALVDGVWTPIGGGGAGILTAPNGSRFRLAVSDTGALSTVASLELGPPPRPGEVSQGYNGTTSVAAWAGVAGATGYKVVDVMPDGTVTTTTVDGSPYAPLGLGNHQIQVLAMNTQGLSAPSAAVAVIGNAPPSGGIGGGTGGDTSGGGGDIFS